MPGVAQLVANWTLEQGARIVRTGQAMSKHAPARTGAAPEYLSSDRLWCRTCDDTESVSSVRGQLMEPIGDHRGVEHGQHCIDIRRLGNGFMWNSCRPSAEFVSNQFNLGLVSK